MGARATGDDDLRRSKTVLRTGIERQRTLRTGPERSGDDHARFALIVAELSERPVHTVACYRSVPPEPATDELLARLVENGVRTLLPMLPRSGPVTRAAPDWAVYTGPDDLVEGRWGMSQPTGPGLGPQALAQADVIIVPGLAATARGDRLGRGGGWYDRALTHATPGVRLVILLNDDEVLDALPTQPWDRPVDLIITPSRRIECPPTGRRPAPA